jgi:hypothetical protein
MVNNLISTVLASSASERAKLTKFKSENPNKVKLSKNNSSNVPSIQIPDSDVLEVSSKFPKDYLGKYVYGEVTKGYGSTMADTGGAALIGFWAKNMRCFYLETKNPEVIAKMDQYPPHTRFVIPRECPLKIVQKCGFNYIVHTPFEPDSL